jgi:hypothetical protein
MTQQSPAVHRTILVVDVEGFGSRRPTNPHRLTIRAGLYRVLDEAFTGAGIPWTNWYREDRGDGVLILAPPDAPKGTFVESLPRELVKALRKHNDAHGKEEQIRLRMALHAGELNRDDHGMVGLRSIWHSGWWKRAHSSPCWPPRRECSRSSRHATVGRRRSTGHSDYRHRHAAPGHQ